MEEIKETGGAIIGGIRMIWPFATLIIDKNKLQLNASVYGTLLFRPADITSIESYGKFLNTGIKINHTVPGYNTHIVFLYRDNIDLINRIREIGLMENDTEPPKELEREFADIQANGAYPIKVPVSIAILLIWNILVLGNRFLLPGEYDDDIPFTGLEAAFTLILIIALLLLTSNVFRDIMLKPGRKLDTFRSFIYLVIVLSVVIITVLVFFPKH